MTEMGDLLKSLNTPTDPPPDDQSLPEILEEKNRIISKLKKRIYNQRIQLEFYIKKEINSPLMVEFAKTCLPELTDENMAVALAMNKFYKEMGMKSRIMDLYDRISSTLGHTNCIIQTQESILNEIINKMQQQIKPDSIKKILGNFDINTNFIEVFNHLLETTMSLKRSMSSFRNCCDRLINTEEKRNEIVEQVYSLPREERTLCNYLIKVQMEKFELENLLVQISKKYKPMENDIDLIENNLQLLQTTLNQEGDIDVPKMLEKVYAQAFSLLTLSREQRERYNREIGQLKEENAKLREIIQHVDTNKSTEDVEKLHHIVKRTISEARKVEMSKTEELKVKEEECEELKKKLSEVLQEKMKLQQILDMEDS